MTLQSNIHCIYMLKNMLYAQSFMISIMMYIIIYLIVMTAYAYGWPLSWPFCPYMVLASNQGVLHKFHHDRS